MHQFPYHLFVCFEWTCGVEIAVVKHGMKISTVVAMDADWEIIYFFSTWPKRQDYRFTQPRTCNLLSQERKKKWTSRHTALLECLFLLQFDKCWEENAVCPLDETEKVGEWMAEMSKYIHIVNLHVCKSGNYQSTLVKNLLFSPTHQRYFFSFLLQYLYLTALPFFLILLSFFLYLCASIWHFLFPSWRLKIRVSSSLLILKRWMLKYYFLLNPSFIP